jgi:hypothetical protein
MSDNNVNTPSDEHNQAVTRTLLPRTLMGGTAAMRAAGAKYLPPFMKETPANHQARVQRSVLFNAFKKAAEDMTGRVFSKPIVLGKDVPPQLVEFAENIDNAGRHLNVFARDSFYDSLQPGIGFIFVEMPPAIPEGQGTGRDGEVTKSDEQASNQRPYLCFIRMEDLIGWKSAVRDGVLTLIQARIRERVTVADGPFHTKDVMQIRVLGPGRWETWREVTDGPNKGKWERYDEGTTSLSYVPLVPIYLNRTGFMTGAPPLADLADLNVCHWQSASDQRNILTVARVPILFATGISAEDEAFEIGASNMIRSSNPDATMSYVEHSGAAIGAGERDLQTLTLQMQALGLQLLVDDQHGQTATGEIRDNTKENSALGAMVTGLQDALEAAFGIMADYMGLGRDAGGSIEVNRDWGITGRMGDVQYLTQAVISGKLDDRTYIDELRRRGVLSDAVDTDAVLHRLDTAPPEIDGPPMHLDHEH